MLTVRSLAWRIIPIARLRTVREHARQGPGSNLGAILIEGVVTNPVQALDRPVSSHEAEEMFDRGLFLGEVGDVEAGLNADPGIVESPGLAFDDDKAARVWKACRCRDRCRPDPAAADVSVASDGGLELGMVQYMTLKSTT